MSFAVTIASSASVTVASKLARPRPSIARGLLSSGRLPSLPHRISAMTVSAATAMGSTKVDDFIDTINAEYEVAHKSFEDNFWATKMGLSGNSTDALTATKMSYEEWLSDKGKLAQVRAMLEEEGVSEGQKEVLSIFEKTFKCYIMEDESAASLRKELVDSTDKMEAYRGKMDLGYTNPADGAFVKASSVQLRTLMRSSDDEAMRKAAYNGIDSIGGYITEKFVEVVKMRNKLAKVLGFVDYYDWKVTQAEGFDKDTLFSILGPLEERTRGTMKAALAKLEAEKGSDALKPWNVGYKLAGETVKDQDPYFPFECAVDVWGRSFAGMSINYRGATMNLDLCDREGKYSNGFCHWPQCAYIGKGGKWVPSRTNFTSLATPDAVGSGVTALTTLMHEGGHAAHFANITQRSPLFSQERAPMSVAYAENQSMFLDSLCNDAAWLGRYATTRDNEVMPWPLIEKGIRAKHPYAVLDLRAMIAVPFFEKALYEMKDEDLTADNVVALARKVEEEIQGGMASRPLLSVPHLLSDEASCYYHGYVLAEMSVHQTRAHFLGKYGAIVDNKQVGKDLAEVYWAPGNGKCFLDLVSELTGKPLAADAWVESLAEDMEAHIAEEKAAYEAAVAAGPAHKVGEEVDLGMRVVLVHGDEVISDSQDGGFSAACDAFKGWVRRTYFKE